MHAVLVRVQTLLLNCPHSMTRLAIDLVNDDEAYLLTLYRTLPRLLRHAILAVVERKSYTRDAPVRPTQEGATTTGSPWSGDGNRARRAGEPGGKQDRWWRVPRLSTCPPESSAVIS